jgi:hypothetical protein
MTFVPRPGIRYDMPVVYGPSLLPDLSEGFETYTAAIAYTTSKDAIAALLPHWFEPADDPTLTVSYTRMVNMDWMGGRNYNIVNALVNVVCVSTDEPIHGPYPIAIWENDCAPIIAGREYLGSPKLMAAIDDVDVFASDFSFGCSEYGAQLVSGKVTQTRELTPEEIAPISVAGRESVSLGWKYIPGVGGDVDADYPTVGYMSSLYDRGMRGRGRFSFGAPTSTEAPYSARIAERLAALPLYEHVDTLSLHSSQSRLFRDRVYRLDNLAARRGAGDASAKAATAKG